MRPRRLIVSLLLVLLALQLPAGADCAAPVIDAQDEVAVGGVVSVRGEHFAAECNDTSSGCSGPRRSPPSRDIRLELRQGNDTIASMRVDADRHYEFVAEFVVPEDIRPGSTLTVSVANNDYVEETVADQIMVVAQ